jgi:hypothetical protein
MIWEDQQDVLILMLEIDIEKLKFFSDKTIGKLLEAVNGKVGKILREV